MSLFYRVFDGPAEPLNERMDFNKRNLSSGFFEARRCPSGANNNLLLKLRILALTARMSLVRAGGRPQKALGPLTVPALLQRGTLWCVEQMALYRTRSPARTAQEEHPVQL